jgi:hypothetical protein
MLCALWWVLGSTVAALTAGMVTVTGLTWLLGQPKPSAAARPEVLGNGRST